MYYNLQFNKSYSTANNCRSLRYKINRPCFSTILLFVHIIENATTIAKCDINVALNEKLFDAFVNYKHISTKVS